MDLFERCAGMIREYRQQPARVALFYRAVDPVDGRHGICRGRRVLLLGSNDYLGLTHDPRVKAATVEAVERFGSSSSGARINNGTTTLHERLEERLAAMKGVESVIVFSNGFLAMLGVLTSLTTEEDVVFCDQENHASLVDGCRLGSAETRVFRHRDTDHLERLLGEYGREVGKLIVVDGVFSQSGRIAPLPRIVELAERHGARLMVDDAHASGVLGPHGHGTADHFGLHGRFDLVAGTFSKALGAIGGFVGTTRDVADFLRYRCRAHLFTAAPPVALVAPVLKVLEILEAEPERRERMWHNTRYLRDLLTGAGFDAGDSETPITPVILGDSRHTLQVAARLERAGFFVNPILPPAVPRLGARLRVTPTAAHTEEDLASFVDALVRVRSEVGIPENVAG